MLSPPIIKTNISLATIDDPSISDGAGDLKTVTAGLAGTPGRPKVKGKYLLPFIYISKR